MVKILRKGPVTKLKEDVAKLQNDCKTYQDNYLRALADFENFRRRTQKELEDFRKFANENLLAELIPVIENFERAFSLEKNTEDNESHIKGIEIAYRQLISVLEKFGLKMYSCLGQEFDPKTCEAVSFIETNDSPKHTIIKELEKGYLYQDRVIRPARVIVAKPISQPSENQEQTSSTDEQKKESESL
jgi:molecular chaperone GrpE